MLTDPLLKDLPTNDLLQSELFGEFSRRLLQEGRSIRFRACGASMSPAIRDGEIVHIGPAAPADLCPGDIVLVKNAGRLLLHRLVKADADQDVFITRGDCGQDDDPALEGAQILGLAQAKLVRIGPRLIHARFKGPMGRALRCAARVQYAAGKLLKGR